MLGDVDSRTSLTFKERPVDKRGEISRVGACCSTREHNRAADSSVPKKGALFDRLTDQCVQSGGPSGESPCWRVAYHFGE